jgi:hypothetical protein
MTIEEKKVGDAATEPSSDGTFQAENGKKAENRIIDYKTYDKVINRLKKTEETNIELVDKISAFESDRKNREESKLAEQGEYKKLLELRQAENDKMQTRLVEAEAEKDSAYKTLTDAQKYQAVYEKLPGKLKNNKSMGFIEIESIALNPETNEIDTQSVDLVVNSFMEEHKDLVDTSHVGRLPGNAPDNSTTPLHKRFKDLPLAEMRKNMANAVKQRKHELGV